MNPLSPLEQQYFESPEQRDGFVVWFENGLKKNYPMSQWDQDRYKVAKEEGNYTTPSTEEMPCPECGETMYKSRCGWYCPNKQCSGVLDGDAI